MKKVIFLALSILMVSYFTGRANYKPSYSLKPSHQSYITGVNSVVNPFLPVSKNSKKLLTDVTLLISNDYYTDFDVLLTNTATDEYWFVNISPNTYQEELTVPAGTYDIAFWPNDMGKYHHYYSIGCGTAGGGFSSKFFYGVNITTEMYCNYIYME